MNFDDTITEVTPFGTLRTEYVHPQKPEEDDLLNHVDDKDEDGIEIHKRSHYKAKLNYGVGTTYASGITRREAASRAMSKYADLVATHLYHP